MSISRTSIPIQHFTSNNLVSNSNNLVSNSNNLVSNSKHKVSNSKHKVLSYSPISRPLSRSSVNDRLTPVPSYSGLVSLNQRTRSPVPFANIPITANKISVLAKRKPLTIQVLEDNHTIYESINNEILKKNVFSRLINNKNRRASSNQFINYSITLYDQFKNDMLDDSLDKNVVNLMGSGLNITKGRFGLIHLIKVNDEIKYFVKKIIKDIYPKSNQENVEVEIKNIKYINQHIGRLPFMVESIILRNVPENKVNKIHNIYIITKYLQGYITLDKYLKEIKKIEDKNIIIYIFMNILFYIKNIFITMDNIGILHIDLNQHLNNIMINPENLDIKLIDYGLCLLKNETNELNFNNSLLYQKRKILVLILQKIGFFRKLKDGENRAININSMYRNQDLSIYLRKNNNNSIRNIINFYLE